MFKYPKLRQTYLFSVISALPNVSDSKSLRSLLWLIGEFSHESGNILAAIQAINSGLGDLPMLAVEEKYESILKSSSNDFNTNDTETRTAPKVSTKILADGTYASEITSENENTSNPSGRQLPNIKSKSIYYKLYYNLSFRFISASNLFIIITIILFVISPLA